MNERFLKTHEICLARSTFYCASADEYKNTKGENNLNLQTRLVQNLRIIYKYNNLRTHTKKSCKIVLQSEHKLIIRHFVEMIIKLFVKTKNEYFRGMCSNAGN